MSLLSRRRFARLAALASGGALLPRGAGAAEEPHALSITPARLDPVQRMEVRKGVKALERSLWEARSREVPNDVDPAFAYLPSAGWKGNE